MNKMTTLLLIGEQQRAKAPVTLTGLLPGSFYCIRPTNGQVGKLASGKAKGAEVVWDFHVGQEVDVVVRLAGMISYHASCVVHPNGLHIHVNMIEDRLYK